MTHVDPRDGCCRSCGGCLDIIDVSDATLTIACVDCADTYDVESDFFNDGCLTYWPAAWLEKFHERRRA